MQRGKEKPDLIQLNKQSADKLRLAQWKRQKRKCAVLKKPIDYKDAVLDHKHKLKHQVAGRHGRGLIRGVLHNNINSAEGAMLKKFKRYGVHKLMEFTTFLRNLADYLDEPPIKQIYIHPNEKPKMEKLSKSEYNLICKHYFTLYPKRRKLPEYPKGRLNKNGKRSLPNKTKFWADLLKSVYKL